MKALTDEQLRSKVKEIAQAVEVTVGDHVDDAALPALPVAAEVVEDAQA